MEIITNSRDYNALRDAWKGWRDVSGKQMRYKYQEFVTLMNKAIKAEGSWQYGVKAGDCWQY